MSPAGSDGWVKLRSVFPKRCCRYIEREEDCSQEDLQEMIAFVQMREEEDLDEAVALRLKRKNSLWKSHIAIFTFI